MNISEVELRDLALGLGQEWKALATYLGFPHAEIYKIKYDRTIDESIFEMLWRWKKRQSRNSGSRHMLRGNEEQTEFEEASMKKDEGDRWKISEIVRSRINQVKRGGKLFLAASGKCLSGQLSFNIYQRILQQLTCGCFENLQFPPQH